MNYDRLPLSGLDQVQWMSTLWKESLISDGRQNEQSPTSHSYILTEQKIGAAQKMNIWAYWSKSNFWIYFYIVLNIKPKNVLVRTKFYWSWGVGQVLILRTAMVCDVENPGPWFVAIGLWWNTGNYNPIYIQGTKHNRLKSIVR
jgi:hypothetical protein